MITLFLLVAIFALGAGIAFLATLTLSHQKKSRISTVLQIQSSSGDSEVMSFNQNFYEDEPEESRQAKIDDAFARIQKRRNQNHETMMEIRRKAFEENEAKSAEGEELKLRSITEGKSEATK